MAKKEIKATGTSHNHITNVKVIAGNKTTNNYFIYIIFISITIIASFVAWKYVNNSNNSNNIPSQIPITEPIDNKEPDTKPTIESEVKKATQGRG